MRKGLPVLILLLWCVEATADVVTDIFARRLHPDHLTYAIGGDVEQQVAQTATAGVSGELVTVVVPVECRSGELILEIRRLDGESPTGEVLSTTTFPASSYPPFDGNPTWVSVGLTTHVPLSAGDRFAIVFRNPTGECVWYRAPDGDTYSGGAGWFVNNTPPTTSWTSNATLPWDQDRPFQTLMVVPDPDRSRPCTVHGLAGAGPGGTDLPIPYWVPVCRCLQDESLRELRCALFHPDLFLMRRIPWPLKPGEMFKVRWTLVPLGKLNGLVELTDEFPAGFKISLESPLTFFAGQLPPGASLTLEYDAVAGAKGGKVSSSLMFGGRKGELGTVIEVDR